MNGEQIGIEYVNGLGEGYFALVDVNFKVEDDGLYNLQIEIDPENEINEGKLMLKDMQTGEQTLITIDELIPTLSN